ncbi:MAG: hypothetical protein ABL982_00060 [Vicinamibacterales bacterium]
MAASYPGSVKSFTALNAGDIIQDTDPEVAYDEITAMQQALLTSGLAHNLTPDSTNGARSIGTAAKFWGQVYLKGITFAPSVELTVASGVVTAVPGVFRLDTESDAAADDLVTITAGTGVAENSVIILRAEDVARVVTLKDGSGNLLLNGDYALDATDRTITLMYDGTNWRELSRSYTATVTVPDGPVVIDRDGTAVTVASTTAETSVYSKSIPGGTLGTVKSLWIRMTGDYLNNVGSQTFTLKVKYGATTILTAAISASANASRGAVILEVLLSAAGATGAQVAASTCVMAEGSSANATGTATNEGATNKFMNAVHNAIAEDSTAAKTLEITAQHNGSSANLSFRRFTVLVVQQ